MDIVKLDICNFELGAPSDMSSDVCSSLPIYEHQDKFGHWSMSFWKPDAEELAILAAGGVIKLDVRAHRRQHPVIGLGALPVTWNGTAPEGAARKPKAWLCEVWVHGDAATPDRWEETSVLEDPSDKILYRNVRPLYL